MCVLGFLLMKGYRVLVWRHTSPFRRDDSGKGGHDILGLFDSHQSFRRYAPTCSHTAEESSISYGVESSHGRGRQGKAAVAED